MPAFAFEIRWDGGEKVSWSYFPDDDSAREFARILMQNFKSNGQYQGSAVMIVKNHEGAEVASMLF
jgi:hypothetical protein